MTKQQGKYNIDDLVEIPAGSVLWEIYGWDNPPEMVGAKEWYIGDIITSAKMQASRYGDEQLFFRHSYSDEDIKYRPHWEPFVPKFNWISDKQIIEDGNDPRAIIEDAGAIITDVIDTVVDRGYIGDAFAGAADKYFRK